MSREKVFAIKIVGLVITSCIIMAIMEMQMEPSYLIKSLVKIGFFLLLSEYVSKKTVYLFSSFTFAI